MLHYKSRTGRTEDVERTGQRPASVDTFADLRSISFVSDGRWPSGFMPRSNRSADGWCLMCIPHRRAIETKWIVINTQVSGRIHRRFYAGGKADSRKRCTSCISSPHAACAISYSANLALSTSFSSTWGRSQGDEHARSTGRVINHFEGALPIGEGNHWIVESMTHEHWRLSVYFGYDRLTGEPWQIAAHPYG